MYFEITIINLEKIYSSVEDEIGRRIFIEELNFYNEKHSDEIERKLENAIERLWKKIKESINTVALRGRKEIETVLKEISNETKKIEDSFGQKCSYIFNEIMRRIGKTRNRIFEIAIGSFPQTVKREDVIFGVSNFSVGLELKTGGDIKASLIGIFKLVAEGKIQITVNYEQIKDN